MPDTDTLFDLDDAEGQADSTAAVAARIRAQLPKDRTYPRWKDTPDTKRRILSALAAVEADPTPETMVEVGRALSSAADYATQAFEWHALLGHHEKAPGKLRLAGVLDDLADEAYAASSEDRYRVSPHTATHAHLPQSDRIARLTAILAHIDATGQNRTGMGLNQIHDVLTAARYLPNEPEVLDYFIVKAEHYTAKKGLTAPAPVTR